MGKLDPATFNNVPEAIVLQKLNMKLTLHKRGIFDDTIPQASLPCHPAAFWPTDLKLGCITSFDILFLVVGFSLVDEVNFMLISSCHFCIEGLYSASCCSFPRVQKKDHKKRSLARIPLMLGEGVELGVSV